MATNENCKTVNMPVDSGKE